MPFVCEAAEHGSEVRTDGWGGYDRLVKNGYTRNKTILSSSGGGPAHVSMPAVHRVSSLLKRWLLGTHLVQYAPTSWITTSTSSHSDSTDAPRIPVGSCSFGCSSRLLSPVLLPIGLSRAEANLDPNMLCLVELSGYPILHISENLDYIGSVVVIRFS